MSQLRTTAQHSTWQKFKKVLNKRMLDSVLTLRGFYDGKSNEKNTNVNIFYL